MREACVDSDVHDRCMEILQDLDEVVEDFSSLVHESRDRRHAHSSQLARRGSYAGSVSSDEFFDAQDAQTIKSQLLSIRRDSQEFDEADEVSDVDSDSSEASAAMQSFSRRRTLDEESALFPAKPKTLIPLPLQAVKRRIAVPPPK